MPFCLVLFHKPGFALDEAETLLSETGLSVERQHNGLILKWQDGPELRLHFASGDDVRREAEEIVGGTPHHKKHSDFDRWFEIAFDDLDEVLDEANTLIEIQLSLQNATGGFLFNSWNGQLTAPDG